MSDKSAFDPVPAHRYFAADCFNRAWNLMDLADRTAAYDLELIDLVHASMWHWSRRPDITDLNRSIGYCGRLRGRMSWSGRRRMPGGTGSFASTSRRRTSRSTPAMPMRRLARRSCAWECRGGAAACGAARGAGRRGIGGDRRGAAEGPGQPGVSSNSVLAGTAVPRQTQRATAAGGQRATPLPPSGFLRNRGKQRVPFEGPALSFSNRSANDSGW